MHAITLTGNDLSITDLHAVAAGAAVQFSDSATFRRAFHKWTGQSPSEFRKNLTDVKQPQGS